MSHQKILNVLESLGLSTLDAEVYLFLGKKGPQKASEIVFSLNIPKQQLYTILKDLQSKGIINATLEHPARFSTEPFEKVLVLFVKARMEEVRKVQCSKKQILTDWQSIKIAEDKDKPSTFKVLEGNNYIYPKLEQMTEEAKTQLSIVFRISELIRINQNEVLDELLSSISRSSIKLRILTDISSGNAKIINSLFHKKSDNLEVRTPDFGLKLPNSMVIRDEDEVAFIIDSNENQRDKKHNTCLWTNCKNLVQSFISVFNGSWNNATEVYKKIEEIKTGKPAPKKIIIKDADEAQKKYIEKIALSQKSIYIITSSKGLIKYWKDKNQTDSWVKKGLYVRIMAPITNRNFEAAKQLMTICKVKHIPEGYIETTIIDGRHLFQFNSYMPRKKATEAQSDFENAIYTDDTHYIEKMENMLNNIWENAQSPSHPLNQQPISASSNVFNEYRTEFKKILGLSYKTNHNRIKCSKKK